MCLKSMQKYNKNEIINKVAEGMFQGLSLRKICQQEGMPNKSTILRWLEKDEELATIIARAREGQIEHYADLMLEKAEACSLEDVPKVKLEIDTIKWIASKLKPKKYGERTTHEHQGNVTLDVTEAARLYDAQAKTRPAETDR